MRIEAIEISWFRGAADPVALDLKSKSVLVYGENGSGKSSFIDAVEYALRDGKIGHLSHEYSGKHQEKGIVNTHIPEGRKTELRIRLKMALNKKQKSDGMALLPVPVARPPP